MRSGGFLAQKFNRSTAREPTTKLSYVALHSPLRQTPVLVAQLKYTKTCIKSRYFVNLLMQGKKNFTPQLFVSVNLLDLVPVDNFYKKLLTELDLHFNSKISLSRPHHLKFKPPKV